MSTTAEIEHRATEWLAREDRGLPEEERRALESWLGESTAHRVAYLRLKAAWGRADRLAALRSPTQELVQHEKLAAVPERIAPANGASRLRIAAAAVGLMVALGALMIAVDGLRSSTSEHHTQVGGRGVVPLADGSKLELNTDTLVRTRLTDEARMVWLDRGEAYFEVARDEARPFIVIAGQRRVTVLGTKFSVRREGDELQVRVVEGKVRVDPPTAPKSSVVAPAVIGRSQVAVARQESTLVAERSPQEIADELAWRQGVLVMNQWTLADAAREFNRYNRKQLEVSPEVAGIRLGGTFEAGNLDVFARLLKDGFGLHVDTGGDRITVSN